MSEDRSHLTPLALAVGVGAISFAAIFFRLASPTPPLASAAIRLAVAALVLSPFVIRFAVSGSLDGRFVRHALLAGVFYALHFGAWVWSLELTTVAASVTLVTATPLLLAVVSLLTGVDRPSRALWTALAVALVGVATIGGVDFGTSTQALLGDGLAFIGAAAMAGYMLVVRQLGPTSVLAFMGVATASGAIVLCGVAVLAGVSLAPASGNALMFLVLSALVPQLIGHNALTWALRHTEPTRVGIATLGEPVGATLLALLVLQESPTPATLVGCGVTLTAVALAVRASRQD